MQLEALMESDLQQKTGTEAITSSKRSKQDSNLNFAANIPAQVKTQKISAKSLNSLPQASLMQKQ